MNNILIISGHPNLSQSVANQTILNELANKLPSAKICRLDSLYSTKTIDVQAEQQALLNADIIVWQFPFYWHSVPALLKQYLDDLFHQGFAHGPDSKLTGKKFLLSFTTRAPKEAYTSEILGNIDDLLLPLKSMAKLCQLTWLEPIYSHGINIDLSKNPPETEEHIIAKAKEQANRITQRVAQ